MICKRCNQDNEPGALNCSYCGASLYSAPLADPGKAMNLISMILGIVALAMGSICSCAFACLGGFVPMILAAVAIILGIIGMKKSRNAGFYNNQGKIGMILGIVALVVIFAFIGMNAFMGAMEAVSTPSYGYGNYYYYGY